MGIPFFKTLYLKVLVITLACLAAVFAGVVFFLDYEPTGADPICAPIAAALLAYFIHLMLWTPNESDQ